MTVGELASRLGVTAGAVSQLERSEQRGSIRMSSLERALSAIEGASRARRESAINTVSPAPFDRREDRVAYELHRAVAKKVIDDHQAVIALMPRNIAQLRGEVRGVFAERWLDRWEELTTVSVGELIDAILATDELGHDLRQNSPFIGVLDQRERLEAIQRASR